MNSLSKSCTDQKDQYHLYWSGLDSTCVDSTRDSISARETAKSDSCAWAARVRRRTRMRVQGECDQKTVDEVRKTTRMIRMRINRTSRGVSLFSINAKSASLPPDRAVSADANRVRTAVRLEEREMRIRIRVNTLSVYQNRNRRRTKTRDSPPATSSE